MFIETGGRGVWLLCDCICFPWLILLHYMYNKLCLCWRNSRAESSTFINTRDREPLWHLPILLYGQSVTKLDCLDSDWPIRRAGVRNTQGVYSSRALSMLVDCKSKVTATTCCCQGKVRNGQVLFHSLHLEPSHTVTLKSGRVEGLSL